MLVLSQYAYRLWIGNAVIIQWSMSITLFLYYVVWMWCSIFFYIINGIGKIQLQFISALFEIVLYIPIAYYLGKVWGVNGIICAMIIRMLILSMLLPLQFKKIMQKTAKGIWNR
jgi:hypothetical protein